MGDGGGGGPLHSALTQVSHAAPSGIYEWQHAAQTVHGLVALPLHLCAGQFMLTQVSHDAPFEMYSLQHSEHTLHPTSMPF